MKKSYIAWKHCFRVEIRADYEGLSQISYFPANVADIYNRKSGKINGVGVRFGVRYANVLYVADSIKTAVAEKTHHSNRLGEFYQNSDEDVVENYYLVIDVSIDRNMEFCDIRGLQSVHPSLYDADDYSKSQEFAEELYDKGEAGVIYDSVRHKGGECAAIFLKEKVVGLVLGTVTSKWNGRTIEIIDGIDEK